MAAPGYGGQGPAYYYYGQPPQYPAASPYGAVAYDSGSVQGMTKLLMGADPAAEKGVFLMARRRRMNARPMFLSVLVPWALFCLVYGALSFSIRYEAPLVSVLLVLLGLLVVAVAGLAACTAKGRWFTGAELEPTWHIFIFLTLLLAFMVALVLGNANFSANMQLYYNMQSLNNYTNVSPARMRGQQLMDAGVVEFVPGVRLDLDKSIGFKSGDMYCAVPVTIGDVPLATYDFWVVGKNCCRGQGGFHCKNFNNAHAHGGMRLMDDSSHPFFRLAVQQAEATYGIKALHPLFFEWVVEPMKMVNGWKHAGRSEYIVWMLSYLVFQTFLVAIAALAFAKLGFH